MTSLALGWLRLALVVVPLVFGSIGLQHRLAPEWTGAPAALVRVVIGLSIGLAVLELVGTIGQFRPAVIVGSEALVGSIVALATGAIPFRRRPTHAKRLSTARSDRFSGPAARLAIGVSAFVFIAWILLSGWLGRRGVMDNDSVRYHGPFVVRWLQTHSLTHLHFTSNRLQETFFPANSELLSSVGVAAFGTDWLTPLLDVGWLAVALFAGWTMVDGPRRPFGLLAVAAVAGSPLLLTRQPGSARNDMAAAALVLAALSIVRRSEWRLGPLAVAGAAAGLALGTKLSVLAPLVVITVGLPFIAPAGRRVRAALGWLGPMCLTGGYWYVRNWVRTGNPLPWYRIDIGPLHLPSPPFVFLASQGQTIADYAGSAHFWTHTVSDGLSRALGRGWPVFLLMGAAGVVLALRSRRRFPVLIAIATVVAVVADVFTPYTAGGIGGPNLFPSQLRFLTLAAVLALLAGVMVLDVKRLWVLPALTVLLSAIGLADIPGYGWLVVCLVAVLVAIVGVSLRRVQPSWQVPARRVVAVGAVVAIVACVPFSQWYDAQRYLIPNARGAAAAFAYFRQVHHSRVAVGTSVHTYPLSGTDLSNFVQTVGTPGAHGAFRPAPDCATWQRLIDRGHYRYVVTGFAHHSSGPPPPEQRWTAQMTDAHVVLRSGTTTVFRIRGTSHTHACRPL